MRVEVWGCVAEAGTVLSGDVEGDLKGVGCFKHFIGRFDTLFPLAMYCVLLGWMVAVVVAYSLGNSKMAGRNFS